MTIYLIDLLDVHRTLNQRCFTFQKDSWCIK